MPGIAKLSPKLYDKTRTFTSMFQSEYSRLGGEAHINDCKEKAKRKLMRFIGTVVLLVCSIIIILSSVLSCFSRKGIHVYLQYEYQELNNEFSKKSMLSTTDEDSVSKYNELLNNMIILTKQDYSKDFGILLVGCIIFFLSLVFIINELKSKVCKDKSNDD